MMKKVTMTMSLKLDKLPDRMPIRVTVALAPDLASVFAYYLTSFI